MSLPRSELRALTGLRAVAALWVVFHHYHERLTDFIPSLRPLQPFTGAGFIGVELFFVLSGFIITLTYANKFREFRVPVYLEFLWRRLARIYPAYLAVLLALVVLVLGAQRAGISFNSNVDYGLPSFIASVFMVQAWTYGEPAYWNLVAWSVSAEWLAYLLFPAFAVLFWAIKSPRAAWMTAYGILIATTILALTKGLNAVFGIDFISVLRILGCFTAGTMMSWLYQRHTAQLNWRVLTPLLAAGIVGTATALTAAGQNAMWSALLMPPFILGLAYQKDAVSRWLSGRFMNYWGQVSYSLYLTHVVVLAILSKVVPPAAFADQPVFVRASLALVYLLAAGLAGMVLFHLLEEPSRKVMQRLWTTRFGNSQKAAPIEAS